MKSLIEVKKELDQQKAEVRSVAQKGFTLIELLIVIAIIGILAAIAIPQYAAYVRTAEATTAAQDFHQAVTAVTAYQAQVQAGVQGTMPSVPSIEPGTDGAVLSISGTSTTTAPGTVTVQFTTLPGNSSSTGAGKDLLDMLTSQTGYTMTTASDAKATITANGDVTYGGTAPAGGTDAAAGTGATATTTS